MVSHSKLVVAAASTLLIFRPDATDAFVADVRPHSAVGPFAVKRPNAAPVLRMAGEYDSLEEKLFKAAAPAPKPPPAFKPAEPAPSPVPAPAVKLELPSDLAPPAPAPEPVTTKVEVAAPPAPAPAPPVESASASIALPDDIPVVPVAAGAFALFAGASFAMRSGKDEREAAQSGGGASTSSGTDLSIPYDAAAKLAYEESGKKTDYASFKAKYEADAVADVKKKTSGDAGDDTPAEGDLSIPYDAAARYAYEHSDKKMDYAAFKTKYEADAVADVKKKAKK